MRTTAKLTAIGTGVTALLAASLAFPSAAHAAPFRCGSSGSDANALCAYVQKAPNGLNVRKGPGTSYGLVGTLPNGTKVEVECWTTGSYVNGYNIWTRLYSPTTINRYVSDYYLTTGRVQDHLRHC